MSIVVAVGQMTSQSDKEANLLAIEAIMAKAQAQGARFLCLPENCVFLGSSSDTFNAREPLEGPSMKRLGEWARRYGMWLSVGGFQELIPGSEKIYNTHVLLDDQGEIQGVYRKIHLFSVKLADGTSYHEDKTVQPGQNLACIQTPLFKVGLSICYDIRFSYLYWALRNLGAQVILVPAAFTDTTGKAHWEIMLRARAIETQSYVLAAAQSGCHNGERKTHGHAMIVDPWGTILAQCGEQNDCASAPIDLEYLQRIRTNMPILEQQRSMQ